MTLGWILLGLLLGPPDAADGEPLTARGDPLAARVQRAGAIAEHPALGDAADRARELHARAIAARAADRPHAALEAVAGPLEWGAAYVYMAAHEETAGEFEAFEELWRGESGLPERARQNASPAACRDAPAHVRAIAERAATRADRYYTAARAQGRAASARAGLFYLGRALAGEDLAGWCAAFAEPGRPAAPEVPDLVARLAALERATSTAYARPGRALEKHAEFIELNASLKLLGELIDEARPSGALYEYLRAVRALGMLDAEPPADVEAVRRDLAELRRRLADDRDTDHGIALALVEPALMDLEEDAPDADRVAAAHVTATLVLPAYLELVGKRGDRP